MCVRAVCRVAKQVCTKIRCENIQRNILVPPRMTQASGRSLRNPDLHRNIPQCLVFITPQVAVVFLQQSQTGRYLYFIRPTYGSLSFCYFLFQRISLNVTSRHQMPIFQGQYPFVYLSLCVNTVTVRSQGMRLKFNQKHNGAKKIPKSQKVNSYK